MRWTKKNVINLVTKSSHLPAPITPPTPEIYRLPNPPPKPPEIAIPPTLTLSPSPKHSNFVNFLENNLLHHQTLTPQTLLRFLRSKLCHHSLFAYYDFAVFDWAATLDAFRHDHDSLRDDINEINQLASFDFEKFLFLIPPPIRITASRPSDSACEGSGGGGSKSSSEKYIRSQFY